MKPTATLAPGARADQTLAWNMRLLAHHELAGFGGIGEGMGMQQTHDGRRILWLAHESAPKNFTGVDVTDPRTPKVIVQTDLPHARMRSNSLDVVGDMMAVAYQTSGVNIQPAGFDLFDVSEPERPQRISHFDASGPHSRGVHALWFVDGEYIHLSGGAADFKPRNPKDDQFYRIIDVRNPAKPREIGRWWLPGTRDGDDVPPPARLPAQFDMGFRAHNTNVFPQRPDRAYVGYIDGGARGARHRRQGAPEARDALEPLAAVQRLSAHGAAAVLARAAGSSSDECVLDDGADWPKLVWVLDARVETNPVPISTFPLPSYDAFAKRGGRFGAHNLHENLPVPTSWHSESIVIGTFFNAGVRAYDVSNPYQPQEIAYFVPGAPKLSPVGAIQLNDVYVDDRGLVFTVDRFAGGLYVLEMTI